jgi:hypothetical protein
MLYLHEVHSVIGPREEAFASAYRDGWMPLLAKGEDARLLWYLVHAHGTGPSYNVVTITAVRDGAAWERLGRRLLEGDLAGWAREAESLRHDVEAKVLVPLTWSPIQDVDLASVPTDGAEHDASLYMEDTAWPYEGKLDEYVEKAGSLYYEKTLKETMKQGIGLLEMTGSFRPAFGAGRWREIVLMQKIVKPEMLQMLFTVEVPAEYRRPGTWMHDALELRDRWRSKILRTARWSPLH